VERVFNEGFQARAEGIFSGTLLDQIRQQGYVPSPTLSLTTSFDTAVLYATARGTEDQRELGVVFSINPEHLCRTEPIWDSFSSMKSGTHVWVAGELDAIAKLVQSHSDLAVVGQFLERISQAVSRRAREFHESPVLQAPVRSYVVDEDWAFGQEVIGSERLEGLCSAFEYLAPFDAPGRTDQVIARGAYALAFAHALPELKRCLAAASGLHRHPGWDTTLFGYIAKTCRDRELFSSGSIQPDAVSEAIVVDRFGAPVERIIRG